MHQAQQLIALIQRKGAYASEVTMEIGAGVRLEVRRGRIIEMTEVEKSDASVRVWMPKRGVVEAQAKSVDALCEKVDDLIARASDAPVDAFATPTHKLPTRHRELGIFDQRWDRLDGRSKVDIIMEAESVARRSNRKFVTGPFTYRDNLVTRCFVNSFGEAASEKSTAYAVHGVLFVEDSLRVEASMNSRSFATVASLPIGAIVAKRAQRLLGETVSLSGPIRVVMPPHISALFIAKMAEVFAWADPEESYLRDAEGIQRSFSNMIHLLDDGSIIGGIRTGSFDDRGITPKPVTLIREGQLGQRLLSPREAKKADTAASGHIYNGGFRLSNLILRPGTRSIEALMNDFSDHRMLVVEVVDGIDDIDLKSGSVKIRVDGYVRQGEEHQGVVRNLSLRASLPELLTRVVALASNTDRVGNVDAPGIVFDGFEA